jgi:hypothetical protein
MRKVPLHTGPAYVPPASWHESKRDPWTALERSSSIDRRLLVTHNMQNPTGTGDV